MFVRRAEYFNIAVALQMVLKPDSDLGQSKITSEKNPLEVTGQDVVDGVRWCFVSASQYAEFLCQRMICVLCLVVVIGSARVPAWLYF